MERKDFTYQDKFNELRLDMTHPNSQGKIYIFLEGESDVKLFRKFFNLIICKVECIPGGKVKLEECVITLFQVNQSIIGIRDADFLNLENKNPSHANIFLTDFHDMEMSLISVDEVFSSILFEFTNLNQAEQKLLRDNILKSISFLGYIKWLNEIENLEINFKGIDLEKNIDFQNFIMDKNKLIKELITQSPQAKEKVFSILLSKTENLVSEKIDLYQLCNGHDFIKALSIYINKNLNKKVSFENLESNFRIAFTFKHFYANTNLYNKIKEWGKHFKESLFVVEK